MKYTIDSNSNTQFPLVQIDLQSSEGIYMKRDSMVYHSPDITLEAQLNAGGSGIGKFFKAIGRSLTSQESMFITMAVASEDGLITLAPLAPGGVIALELGEKQYRLNDNSFLAMDKTAFYSMKRQSIGRALFGGQGGFFVMTTEGKGTLLVNAFGSIQKLTLNNSEMVVNNYHVIAWSTSLDYSIQADNGIIHSIGTGAGLVNVFRGTGEIYVQSLDLRRFANVLIPYIVSSIPANKTRNNSFD